MNTKHTHHWLQQVICTLLVMMATMTATYAQPRDKHFDPEQFRAHLEGYISREAGLTSSESKAFFPLFHKMKEEQRSLVDEIFRLKRNGPANNASDKDFASAVQRIKSLEVKKAEVEEQYYKKMCKTIPARKVYLAMKAEDKFHRKMLRDFNPQDKRK